MVVYEKQWAFLEKALRENTLSHAYLLTGEKELGKTRFAYRFVKFLNCEERGPCGRCASCLMMEKGTHPDVFFIKPEKGEIHIGKVRELGRKLSLKPSYSQFKTGVVKDAHLMNHHAQNSLLKTLEEPKGETLLFLVASRPHFLLPTIRSRVQALRFTPLKKEKLEKFLLEKGASEKKAREVSSLADGRKERALRFLKDKDFLKKEKERRKEVEKILSLDLGGRFEMAKSLSKKNVDEILLRWLRYLRTSLLEGEEVDPLLGKRIRAVEKSFYLSTKTNANKKIILQNLMLKL